ncbi:MULTISPECIES: phosphoribosylglycinamide formyltransferase [Clostridium]|uniref:Phosphoribosylglycinamide formyltransferase n=4 Tax=Clostridium TaxID=1485 RepID=D8GPL7_CLOLD|nr:MULTISPECIES: phosphoribosylglycinamide formyltransferase [Clostridium]ADK13926.1 folate-dependent phosphoribosylglycinamide formyltransferase PurN [Clostridium ljungdahlii DSM 13528]AGY77157.1 phosphoribosylglycinamide formyltransferase [Clostridium autoethanogenum DSM 10061]ALU37298.1 Phosphoribosylglycinamide formyltransferase [Clostridium autoethanogenum DSM 10061]OAA87417.1 Phosphoribosylglycinamide formyltransferase [Clostridium ljungdahlii DSM 13528]OAA93558.1 Phosphoribosylglycinami
MFKIAVLVSGGGTDLQSIIDAVESGYIKSCSIEAVIGDRPGIYALERAEKHNIKSYVLDKKIHKSNISQEILKMLKDKVDLIVCAGWLSILKGELISEFRNKIVNIHPSLIPSFCGDGMYGIKVHEKAIEYGVKVSGCTVHFVDEGTDSGPIIIQKTVPVYFEDTPEMLQKRILEEEHKALPEVIKLISENKIVVENRIVKVCN